MRIDAPEKACAGKLRGTCAAAVLSLLAACATSGGDGGSLEDEAASSEARPGDDAPETTKGGDRGIGAATTRSDVLARFAPVPDGRDRTVDYALIDEALDLMVFNAGPSLRRRERRPDPLSGTRFVRGHDSPYRLEGNKIFFSQFDDGVTEAVSQYRQSLESIGASGAVQKLPKNEQLAFWYNLHNFVVIDEITKEYPTKYPRRLKIGSQKTAFHDAPVVDLGLPGGSLLSLRELREIVYAHWDDPKVIYGFYRGDLGGPSIRSEAYKGDDVGDDLDRQAREFVNSLRGVARGRNTLYVSEIYDEARDRYFPAWPGDLKSHLLEYADEEVADIIREKPEIAYGQYQERVADMSGGETFSDLGNRGTSSSGSTISPQMVRMVGEYRRKLDELRQQGYLKPKVVIIDIPTDDDDNEGGDVE